MASQGKIQVDLLLNTLQAKGQLEAFVSRLTKAGGFAGVGGFDIKEAARKWPALFNQVASEFGVKLQQATVGGIAGGIQKLSKYVVGRGLSNLAFGNLTAGVAGLSGAAFASGNPYALAAAAAVNLSVAFGKLTAEMYKWAEAGAKLFQRAAAVGLTSGQTFLAQSYAQLLGVSPDQIENLLLRGQFGSGQRSGGGARGGIAASIPGLGYLAGRGPSGAGEVQQITNMAKSLKDYADSIKKTLAEDVALTQRAAGFNERVTLGFDRVKQEIEVFKMTVVSDLAPVLNVLTEAFARFFHNLSLLADRAKPLFDKLIAGLIGIISIKSPNLGASIAAAAFGTSELPQNNQRVTPFQRGGATALEKMGLVIGGGHDKVLTKLTQIEQNTRAIANHLRSGILSAPPFGHDALGLYDPKYNTP